MSGEKTKRGRLKFLLDNSVFLITGAIAALVWANFDKTSYGQFINTDLLEWLGISGVHHDAPPGGGHGHHGLSVHFVISDILMAFFFAIAGKEVWEALLPGGPLSNMLSLIHI